MNPRQRVQVLPVLGKQLAMACRDRGTEAHLAADCSLALAAGPGMTERVGEMLDAPRDRVLQEFAVLGDLPLDLRGRGQCQIAMRGGVPADGHERVLREL